MYFRKKGVICNDSLKLKILHTLLLHRSEFKSVPINQILNEYSQMIRLARNIKPQSFPCRAYSVYPTQILVDPLYTAFNVDYSPVS